MDHDVDDEEKISRMYELIEDADWDELFTDFERKFIYDNYIKTQETNIEFSAQQSRIIDECYEKAVRQGALDR